MHKTFFVYVLGSVLCTWHPVVTLALPSNVAPAPQADPFPVPLTLLPPLPETQATAARVLLSQRAPLSLTAAPAP